MKNTILTLIILQYGICYGQVTFQKVYGGWADDVGYSLRQTPDSGFIFAGSAYMDSGTGYDFYLVKTDFKGDLIWTKTYGMPGVQGGRSVVQSSDGGFVITGYSMASGDTVTDILLLKTQSNGDTLWCKKYGGPNMDRASCVQQISDGGYIITGYTSSFGAGSYDMFLIRADSTGSLLWSKTYGGTNVEYGDYVAQTTDSGFIITGASHDFATGYDDVFIVKTDLNGDTLWTKAYGGIYDDWGNEVHQTSDGGYIITGTTMSSGSGNPHVFLIKTDMNGNLVWTKVYGGGYIDRGNSVKQTTDGGYIIAGSSSSFGALHDNVYLIKTDVNGDTLWTKTFGGTYDEIGFSVGQTYDGGYAIGGITISLAGTFYYDFYFVKTDTNGNSGCYTISPPTQLFSFTFQVSNPPIVVSVVNTIETSESFLISQLDTSATICTSIGIDEIDGPKTNIFINPNPFSDKINIHGTKSGEVMLYDLCGRQVLKQKTFNSETILNTEIISPGIYLLHYYDNNTIVNFKLIKQ